MTRLKMMAKNTISQGNNSLNFIKIDSLPLFSRSDAFIEAMWYKTP